MERIPKEGISGRSREEDNGWWITDAGDIQTFIIAGISLGILDKNIQDREP